MYWRVLVIYYSAKNSEGLDTTKVHLQGNGFTVHSIKGTHIQ